ncbi:hypothetical protein QUF76_19270, partial [Desulfobacterales bacterium HSG16]|nr:hypothetical protein [Desulfobacterales bacterium HSG16]
NDDVLAFKIENYEIKTGDIIIVKTANDKFFRKPVLEIQINNVSHVQISIQNRTDIAVRMEPKIKKNQEFFIKKMNPN